MDIKDIAEKNKKYIIYIIFGLVLMLLPSIFSTEKDVGSTEEIMFESFLEQTEGVGDTEVMIKKDKNGDVQGIIIAAKGAENPNVIKTIKDAAVTLFGVEAHKVKVFKYSQEGK